MMHAGGFSAARQPAAVSGHDLGDDIHSSNSSATGAIGISAFAFQGTNAHMLVAATAGSSAAPELQHSNPAVWQRRRYWYAPEPSALLVAGADRCSRTAACATLPVSMSASKTRSKLRSSSSATSPPECL